MVRIILGIIVAQIVVYLWGFLFWGLGPYRDFVWKKSNNDAAVQQLLRDFFPTKGTYFIPSEQDDPEETERLHVFGPLAMVHVLTTHGRPSFDKSVMINGFVLNLAFIVLIAVWMQRYSQFFPAYRDRFGFVAWAGVIAAVLIDGGSIAWWRIDIPWKLYQGLYDASVWIIVGAILAASIKPVSSSTLENTEGSPA